MSKAFPFLYEIGQNCRSSINSDRALTADQREAQAQLRERFPTEDRPGGIAIPWHENRALTATGVTTVTGDQGGMTIGMGVPEIGLAFRDALVLARLGASIHAGFSSNAQFPREKPGIVASWLPENIAPSGTTFTFGNLTLVAHRISAYLDVSDQLLLQGEGIETFLRLALMGALAEAVQSAAIAGTGSSNQPAGILTLAGIPSITPVAGVGAAPTYADLQGLEYQVTGVGKSGQANTGWLVSPNVRKKFRNVFVNGTGSQSVWSLDSADTLLGYPAGVTTAAPDNLNAGSVANASAIVFGKWSELQIAFWGPGIFVEAVRIVSSPSNVPGLTRFIASCYFDAGVRTPGVFATMAANCN